MPTDIWTIMRKELQEIVLQRGLGARNLRGGWLGLLLVIGVFGIFMPLQFGPEWVSSPLMLTFWAWVPFVLAASLTADSFAGERERHTLETLLASRLSDRAILFGKLLAVTLYGWTIVVASLLLGLITVNVAHWNGQLQMYPPVSLVGGIVLGLFGSALPAAIGVLVSLRAGSVRQAAQTMSLSLMVLVFGLAYGGPFVFRRLPPATQARIVQWAETADVAAVVAVAVAILAALTVVFVLAAMARFQRARLILD